MMSTGQDISSTSEDARFRAFMQAVHFRSGLRGL